MTKATKNKVARMKRKAKTQIYTAKTQPISNPLAPYLAKIKRVKELRAKLNSFKTLYQEHDQLMKELLPMFIEKHPDKFIIAREVKLGTEVFRLSPHFYDEKKDELLAKNWKSTAHETFTIG